MKHTIICYKDHHWQWDGKTIRTLNDLYTLIHNGFIWFMEDEKHDEKVVITIETEEE